MPKTSLTRHFAALVVACLCLGAGAGAAQAATTGVVPPSNPARDCGSGGSGLDAINACRAAEGVGPLILPSNFGALTPVQQGFVVIDLERVNRGLPAIVGLTSPLDSLASSGAAGGTDPSFPSGNVAGGAIWAGAYSVLQADYLWMYADGPGGNNLDCRSGNTSGCWGHRDIILWDRTPGPLVSGGGFATAGGTDSLAYLVLSGYSSSSLSFSWAGELRYFAAKPSIEPLGTAASTRRHKRARHRRHRRRHHKAHHSVTGSSSSSSSSDGGPMITIG